MDSLVVAHWDYNIAINAPREEMPDALRGSFERSCDAYEQRFMEACELVAQ